MHAKTPAASRHSAKSVMMRQECAGCHLSLQAKQMCRRGRARLRCQLRASWKPRRAMVTGWLQLARQMRLQWQARLRHQLQARPKMHGMQGMWTCLQQMQGCCWRQALETRWWLPGMRLMMQQDSAQAGMTRGSAPARCAQ